MRARTHHARPQARVLDPSRQRARIDVGARCIQLVTGCAVRPNRVEPRVVWREPGGLCIPHSLRRGRRPHRRCHRGRPPTSPAHRLRRRSRSTTRCPAKCRPRHRLGSRRISVRLRSPRWQPRLDTSDRSVGQPSRRCLHPQPTSVYDWLPLLDPNDRLTRTTSGLWPDKSPVSSRRTLARRGRSRRAARHRAIRREL